MKLFLFGLLFGVGSLFVYENSELIGCCGKVTYLFVGLDTIYPEPLTLCVSKKHCLIINYVDGSKVRKVLNNVFEIFSIVVKNPTGDSSGGL